jgi:biopolymer transport protein ExbD
MAAIGKHLKKNARNRSTVEIMMTPMIDVVFLLIIFFLSSTGFEMIEKMMPSSVSREASSSGGAGNQSTEAVEFGDVNDVVIKIHNVNNQIVYEMASSNLVDLSEVNKRLRTIVDINSDVPIVIHPDDEIDMATSVRVYDVARSTGALRVFFATR